MTISELEKKIKPNMCGAFLFYGEEEYLKRHYLNKIRKTILTDSSFEVFNHTVINDAALDKLLPELQTLPVFAERRLVEIRDISFGKLKDDDAEELCEIVKNLTDCVLIIYALDREYDAGTVKKPSALQKKLSQAINTVEFERQTPQKLTSWVSKHFIAYGCYTDFDVCRKLIERCGTDMFILANEIEKLCAYALSHGKNNIDESMLKISSSYQMIGAFDFVNAIMECNTKKAFRIFSDMKLRREKPHEINSVISRVFNELLLIKTMNDAGMSAAEIAKAANMHEYSVKLRLSGIKNRSAEEIARATKLCYEADIKIKSTPLDKYLVIENLILAMS